MSYVGNMYSHLPVSVSKLNTMQCIVDVFTSGWINGKDWDMTQISSARLKLNLVVCWWKARKDLCQINVQAMKVRKLVTNR